MTLKRSKGKELLAQRPRELLKGLHLVKYSRCRARWPCTDVTACTVTVTVLLPLTLGLRSLVGNVGQWSDSLPTRGGGFSHTGTYCPRRALTQQSS